jgi:folate-dependent phosphoribosylglycinamide formyltransferase PurN
VVTKNFVVVGRPTGSLVELVQALASRGSVRLVVVERTTLRKNLSLLGARLRMRGPLAVLDQLGFLALRWLQRDRRNPSTAELTQWLGELGLHSHQVLVTDALADPETIASIRDASPDLTVVWGSSILHPAVLDALGPLRLGYHAGWLPDFRGVYGAYWALAAGQPQRVGASIFTVVRRVDAGAIVRRGRVAVDLASDSLTSIGDAQRRIGLQLLLDAVDVMTERGWTWALVSRPGRLYSHPGLSSYLRFRLMSGLR